VVIRVMAGSPSRSRARGSVSPLVFNRPAAAPARTLAQPQLRQRGYDLAAKNQAAARPGGTRSLSAQLVLTET